MGFICPSSFKLFSNGVRSLFFLCTNVLIFWNRRIVFLAKLKTDLGIAGNICHVDNLFLGGENWCRKKKFFK